MNFIGNLERNVRHLPSRLLDYNGCLYTFREGVIPDLKGSGFMVIVTRPSFQYQGYRGPLDNLCMRQVDGTSFINGINVDDLVREMKPLKISFHSKSH